MAAETAYIRTLARRVKQKALEEAEFILNNKDTVAKELYEQTYLTVLKNAVPRSQELTGEDGERILIPIYGGNSVPEHNSNQEDIPATEEN